jgi:hypothetical protein
MIIISYHNLILICFSIITLILIMRIFTIIQLLLTIFLSFAFCTDSLVKCLENTDTRVIQLSYCIKKNCGYTHEFLPSYKMNCFERFIFGQEEETSHQCLKKLKKMFIHGRFIQVNIDQLPQNLLSNISK